jgi:hypothetical protein
MPRAILNQTFGGYRHLVENCTRDYQPQPLPIPVLVAYIGGQAGVPLPFGAGASGAIPDRCALALAAWLFAT